MPTHKTCPDHQVAAIEADGAEMSLVINLNFGHPQSILSGKGTLEYHVVDADRNRIPTIDPISWALGWERSTIFSGPHSESYDQAWEASSPGARVLMQMAAAFCAMEAVIERLGQDISKEAQEASISAALIDHPDEEEVAS